MSFIPWWGKYPNVNNEILNLDWILSEIDRLKNEVSNFIITQRYYMLEQNRSTSCF